LLTEGKLGNFILFIGMMFVGASIVYTGISYLLSETGGSPTYVFLLGVIAVGIAIIIAGALLAKHYL
jgi:hypothetical protein